MHVIVFLLFSLLLFPRLLSLLLFPLFLLLLILLLLLVSRKDVQFSTVLDTPLFIFERKMSKRLYFHDKLRENMNPANGNRSFVGFIVPLFQNECFWKTFHIKMSLMIYFKMNL